MNRLRTGAIPIALQLLLLLTGCGGGMAPGASTVPIVPDAGSTAVQSCGDAAPGFEQCFALIDQAPGPTLQSLHIWGYGPADLAKAYKLPSATAGKGHTVAIIDAYDNPNAESGLATYRAHFNLSACTTANGCFRKVDEYGGKVYPTPNVGWGQEIALDVEMASATCPNCKILLVEAKSSSIQDLGNAVNEAARLGANAISNSWGHTENAGDSNYDKLYFNHPGIAITAATGDTGMRVYYPAASQYVTAVGGTTLAPATNARGFTETAWSSSGGGCSINIPKPAWQHDKSCPNRTVGDVAALANPQRGVAVYLPYGSPTGWYMMGGTSASAPIVAGIYALGTTPTQYASAIYSHPTSLLDITSGATGSCSIAYLCTAVSGYDAPTGLGTPNGLNAF